MRYAPPSTVRPHSTQGIAPPMPLAAPALPHRQSAAPALRAQADMSLPLPFRSSLFDGAFSVSAIQFLCHDTDQHDAQTRSRRRGLRTSAPNKEGDRSCSRMAGHRGAAT